jgi:sulfur carrier protein ThiS
MVRVELTSHLFTFFPHLKGQKIELDVRTARDVVDQLEILAPGIGFYLCDELGSLRTHVNVFIDDERLMDRRHLTDRISDGQRVLVMQALSGG